VAVLNAAGECRLLPVVLWYFNRQADEIREVLPLQLQQMFVPAGKFAQAVIEEPEGALCWLIEIKPQSGSIERLICFAAMMRACPAITMLS
jgi:hypothetical protein